MPDSLNVTFPDSLLDWSPKENTGYTPEVAAEDSVETFAAAGFVDFPDKYWIEPKDWEEVARENDKYGTWAEDYSNRFTNQSPTHECTTHCLIQCAECTWNKMRESKEYAVWFSALGTYEEANPRIRGGASVRGVLKLAMARGLVPEHDGPAGPGTQADKFVFTRCGTMGRGNATQSHGEWLPYKKYPPGHRNTSRHFRPLEIINVASWEQHFCLLLNGLAVGNGRYGHSIPHMRAVKRNGRWHSRYKDSYDLFRYDSIKAVRSGIGAAYAIASMTRPDDWKRPAGEDMRS